ncbi:MAG TPA: hypothetical protein PLP53_04425 [Plasticicumulans sp.]|nr:hypothetical protein [Plasticicumulans sp.]
MRAMHRRMASQTDGSTGEGAGVLVASAQAVLDDALRGLQRLAAPKPSGAGGDVGGPAAL